MFVAVDCGMILGVSDFQLAPFTLPSMQRILCLVLVVLFAASAWFLAHQRQKNWQAGSVTGKVLGPEERLRQQTSAPPRQTTPPTVKEP